MPLLSIIVPIYRTEKYLSTCIDSILSQSFRDYELILVDDGSPDSCPKICDNYALEDSRIKVIHQKNKGVVAARKSGVKVAQGRYIGYVDSDDWIDSDYYERVIALVIENEADMLTTGFTSELALGPQLVSNGFVSGIYRNETVNQLRLNAMCKEPFYTTGIIPSLWTKVFSKQLLFDNQMNVDEKITNCEDCAVTFTCVLDADCIIVDNGNVGYHYRQNMESMSYSYGNNYYGIICTYYDYMNNVLQNRKEGNMQKQLLLSMAQLLESFLYSTLGRNRWRIGRQVRDLKGIIEKDCKYGAEHIDFDAIWKELPSEVRNCLSKFAKREYKSLVASWYFYRIKGKIERVLSKK